MPTPLPGALTRRRPSQTDHGPTTDLLRPMSASCRLERMARGAQGWAGLWSGRQPSQAMRQAVLCGELRLP